MSHPEWQRRIAFVTCLFAYLCESANTNMIAALFPPFALEVGLNETQVGVISGMLDLANLVGQMTIAPVIIPRTRKLFYAVGLFVSGTSVLLFGFITNESDPNLLFILCVCARATMGIGAALVCVSIIPMVLTLYPEKAAIVSSAAQISFGMGGVLGAPLGSLFSTLAIYLGFNGISFPFYLFGGFQICLLISSILFAPSGEQHAHTPGKTISRHQFYSFIGHSNLWFITMPTLFVLVSAGFKDVAYSPYFEDTFGIDSESVGFAFLPLYCTYASFSLLWGILNHHGEVRYAAITTVVTAALCPFLFFLPNLLPALLSLPYTLMVTGLVGVAISSAFCSGFLVFEKVAEINGFTNVEMNRLMAAGWYNSVRAAGRIMGSFLIGGVVLQHLQFYYTCLLHASLAAVFGIIAFWQLWKIGLFQKSYYTVEYAHLNEGSSVKDRIIEAHENIT